MKKDSDTVKYLDSLESFERFIDEYNFRTFVDENYDVKNLVNGGIITSYDEYVYSFDINKKYLENLIAILAKEV